MTGLIRFAATPAGGTRLVVELTYRPRHTDLGEAIHALTTQSRQEQIRADLRRASFYIESLPTITVPQPAA